MTDSPLTLAMEDYVAAVYRLQLRSEGSVTTTALASAMNVTPASATHMIKAMTARGLAEHSKYRGVRLSPEGQRIALQMIRRHRLLERYLETYLGYRWDEVHPEADRLEHVISDQFEERIAALLGHPETDPHGQPIPTRDGRIAETSVCSLKELPQGEHRILRRVETSGPEQLRYLASLGLIPGTAVTLVERHPFEGPIELLVGERTVMLNPNLAAGLLVDADSLSGRSPQ